MSGPVSLVLEQELAREVRRQGIVVWLDRDASFNGFVDRLAAREDKFACPVVGFRGSFLETLFALESHGSGYDKGSVVVHMPGFNEQTIRTTPMLELYEAGARFRCALDSLVREAATGRMAPQEVDSFLAGKPTLEQADDWLAQATASPGMGLQALLDVSGPTLIAEALADRSGPAANTILRHGDEGTFRIYVRNLVGMDDQWFGFAAGDQQQPDKDQVLNALGAWLLCVEYVHDLRRAPHLKSLQPLKALSPALVKTNVKLVASVRERHGDAYARLATDVESLIRNELDQMTPEDLGQIDTFKEEEDRVLGGAVAALKARDWSKAVTWCKEREGEASFWIKRDPMRRRAWDMVGEAAAFGSALTECPRPFADVTDHLGAVQRYGEKAAKVDRAHRRFEQERARRLDPQLPHFGALQEVVGILRQMHRDWADHLCRDYSRVCTTNGFLPAVELRQRTLYEQVVQPLALGGEQVAVFVVDAFRYEMATELLEELRANGGTSVIDLKARVAELPTITSVGMNVLAPVAKDGRLTPVADLKGFRTGEYTVNSRDTRVRSMGMRTSGKPALLLDLADVCDGRPPSAKTLKDHQIIVVHSTEIDDAGEANVGVHVFEATLRMLKAAWHHLQAAGVKQAVFTADHGFLLQDETTQVHKFGKKSDPQRRHVVYPQGPAEPGMVPVPFAALEYDGLPGYLLLREDTGVFATTTGGGSFVHGGNSPQERFIPVLTVTRKRAEAPSRAEYAVEAEALHDAFGFHRLRLRVVFPADTQTSLAFAAVRSIDLDLQVPGRKDVRAIVKEVSGAGTAKGGRIQAPVSEAWTEVFFALEGPADDRAPVEVIHTDNIEKVRACALITMFSIAGTQKRGEPVPASAAVAWADNIEDAGIRGVFLHIHKHGSVTESEVIAMLGNARAARRFALDFDDLVAKLPFTVRSEANASGKRYVREEER